MACPKTWMSQVYLEHRDAHHVPGASTEVEIQAAVARAAQALSECDAWMVSAGAGMGVDSGLPDFRGTTGLWKDRDLAMTYEDMSDDKWFSEDAAFAWGVNYIQLQLYRKAVPHEGYQLLFRWIELLGRPYFVFSSNIDGQFEKTGFPPDKVVACHGDLHHLQCTKQKCKHTPQEGKTIETAPPVWSSACIPDGLDDAVDQASLRFRDVSLLETPPFRCLKCQALARPNVWFCHDRNYVASTSTIETRDAFNSWIQQLHKEGKRIVVIECGGGVAIPSVRVESEDAVEGAGEGSLLVRLNPGNCRIPSERAVGLPLGAKDGIKRIDAALQALMGKRLAAPVPKSRSRSTSQSRRTPLTAGAGRSKK